jgi:hypothetical protein
MKFSINKYSHVFNNRVGLSYGELAKFIITDQYIGFPGDEYSLLPLLLLSFI